MSGLRVVVTKRVAIAILLCVGLFSARAASAAAAKPYSPHVDQTYPTNVYWGDTHLHTYLSGDAFGMGTRLTPDDAYRFAKGETLRATGGDLVRLRRPLDFLMVADHAERLGELPRLAAGDPRFLKTPDGQRWSKVFAETLPLADVLQADSLEAFRAGSKMVMANKSARDGAFGVDADFRREAWLDVIEVAEQHNHPGTFTTFAGFEYSSNPPMLHRNVLFAGGPDETRQILPFSKYDSSNPEDLWAHLAAYEKRTGSEVMSIPHNGNLSQGAMFSPLTYAGAAMTSAYVKLRAHLEPLTEVTQIKGDSETHPLVSPDDAFADYETWGGGKIKPGDDANARAAQSYARSALKLGLEQQARLGVNPFKFGMIGSTDSHNGVATAAEDNFWGKMGTNEPSPYRAIDGAIFAASGYAAVWAEANTREALFAALKRREVYATTGPRITLRFFGGWDYAADDASSPDLAAIGYRKGTPMGGDLTHGETRQAPSFLIHAVKDPDGANLDRIQVIKGWRNQDGSLLEKVHDVAWSDEREIGKDGKLEPVESTVDVTDATFLNSVGEAELAVTWVDPDFDPQEAAFYYVRVIQIPTPRWTGYDAARYNLKDLPETIPLVTQERAYSSPIWHTP